MLSDAPYWYVGHFTDGRMYPCQGVPCSLCGDGIGQQVRYVFAIADVSTRRPGLIEVSKSVADLIRTWCAEFGGLRGMLVELFKHSHSVRSRTEVSLIREDPGHWYQALEVPDPELALELTWKKQGAKRQVDRVSVRSPLEASGPSVCKPKGLV
jgi:hypothetical protein